MGVTEYFFYGAFSVNFLFCKWGKRNGKMTCVFLGSLSEEFALGGTGNDGLNDLLPFPAFCPFFLMTLLLHRYIYINMHPSYFDLLSYPPRHS